MIRYAGHFYLIVSCEGPGCGFGLDECDSASSPAALVNVSQVGCGQLASELLVTETKKTGSLDTTVDGRCGYLERASQFQLLAAYYHDTEGLGAGTYDGWVDVAWSELASGATSGRVFIPGLASEAQHYFIDDQSHLVWSLDDETGTADFSCDPEPGFNAQCAYQYQRAMQRRDDTDFVRNEQELFANVALYPEPVQATIKHYQQLNQLTGTDVFDIEYHLWETRGEYGAQVYLFRDQIGGGTVYTAYDTVTIDGRPFLLSYHEESQILQTPCDFL